MNDEQINKIFNSFFDKKKLFNKDLIAELSQKIITEKDAINILSDITAIAKPACKFEDVNEKYSKINSITDSEKVKFNASEKISDIVNNINNNDKITDKLIFNLLNRLIKNRRITFYIGGECNILCDDNTQLVFDTNDGTFDFFINEEE